MKIPSSDGIVQWTAGSHQNSRSAGLVEAAFAEVAGCIDRMASAFNAEGEDTLAGPRPPVVVSYDLRHGLLDNICLKSFVRWIGVNPGPG